MTSTIHNEVDIDGNKKTTTKYQCKQEDFQYTTLGNGYEKDFDFLKETGEMGTLLDDFLKKVRAACEINDAFNINDTHHNIEEPLYGEIEKDVNNLKKSLSCLNEAFVTDIHNINAELKVNFGCWIGNNAKVIGETTETIE